MRSVLMALVRATLMGMFIVILATFWSIAKMRERTECYRHAQHIEDCQPPGWLERQLKALLS